MINRILLVVTGIALVGTAVAARDASRRETFWREMYIGAERDAAFKNCVDVDDEHVICQRPR